MCHFKESNLIFHVSFPYRCLINRRKRQTKKWGWLLMRCRFNELKSPMLNGCYKATKPLPVCATSYSTNQSGEASPRCAHQLLSHSGLYYVKRCYYFLWGDAKIYISIRIGRPINRVACLYAPNVKCLPSHIAAEVIFAPVIGFAFEPPAI